MKTSELRAMTDAELLEQVDELQKQLYLRRTQNVTKELDNSSLLNSGRKDIARVKTILRERKILV